MKRLLRCIVVFATLHSGGWAGPQVIGSWSFNGEDPTRVVDAGPYHLDGRAVNVQGVPGSGEEGLALRFSNPGARVDMPSSDRYACGGGSFVLRLWVRTFQRQAATILALADRNGATRLRLSIPWGGRVQLELWGPLQPALISRTSVADGDWHYITAVYESLRGQAFLYVDDGFSHCAHLPPGGPTQVALRMGNDFGADRPFRGDLDDVILTAGITAEVERVLTRYRSWGEPPPPGPPGPPLPDFSLPATPPQGGELRAHLETQRAALRRWLGTLPQAPSATEGEAVNLPDLRATPVTVETPEMRVPAVVVTPAGEETPTEQQMGTEGDVTQGAAAEGERLSEPGTAKTVRRPAAILADPEGKATVMEGRRSLLDALVSAGAVACAVDVSPDAYTGARQLLSVAAYLRSRPDVRSEEMLLVCWGADATPGLVAVACDPGITRAVILEATGDAIPPWAATVAPRPLWVQGNLERAQWEWSIAAYRELAPENLLLSTGAVSAPEIAAWLPGRP